MKVLQYFQIIAKIIAKCFKYCKRYCKISKELQKVLQHFKVLQKVLQNFAQRKMFLSCAIIYWILIGNNYVCIIYLSLIYLSFFVIDSLWWIKLFPYVIFWIQKLSLLYNLFDEYNYIMLKFYLKISIDQYMIRYFLVIRCDMG